MEGGEPSSREGGEKKGPFDVMDREQLIKKCKGLLGIAQMAKKAKDELSTENINLKEIVAQYETKTVADKECLKTMKEMVDSLTEYKLTTATKTADLERHNDTLKVKLRDYEQMSIENEGMKRQITRLTEENDEQALDLKTLDDKLDQVNRMSQQQNEQLKILEQSVIRWQEMEVNYNRLQEEYEHLKEQQQRDRDAYAELEGLRMENKECKNAHNQMTLLHEKTIEDFERVSKEMRDLQEKLLKVEEGVASETEKRITEENRFLKEELHKKEAQIDLYEHRLNEVLDKLNALKMSRNLLAQSKIEFNHCMVECKNQISSCSAGLVEQISALAQQNAALVEDLKVTSVTLEQLKYSNEENQCTKDALESKCKGIQLKYDDLLKSNEEQSVLKAEQNQAESASNAKLLEIQLEFSSIKEQLEVALEREKQLTATNQVLHQNLEVEVVKANGFSIQIEEQNSEIRLLRDKLEAVQKEFNNDQGDLLVRLTHLEDDIQKYKNDFLQLESALQSNNSKCDIMQEQYDELSKRNQNELIDLRETNEALKNRNSSLVQEMEIVRRTEDELHETNEKQKALIQENTEIIAKMKILEEAECKICADLRRAIKKKSAELETLQTASQETNLNNEAELKSCMTKINEMNDANEALKNRIMSLVQEMEIIKSADAECVEYQKKLEEKQAEIVAFTNQLDLLKHDVDTKEVKIKNLEENGHSLLTENKHLKSQLDGIKQDDSEACEKLQHQIGTLNTQMQAIQNQVEEKGTEIAVLTNKLSESTNESKKKTTMISTLENKLQDIETKYEQLNTESQSLQNATCTTCEQLRQNIAQIQLDRDTHFALMSERKSEMEAIENRLIEIEGENNTKMEQIKLLERGNRDMQMKCDDLSNSLESSCNECNELRQNISRTLSELEQFKKLSNSLEIDVRQKSELIDDLKRDKSEKLRHIAILEANQVAEAKKLNELSAELNRVKCQQCLQCVELGRQLEESLEKIERTKLQLLETEKNTNETAARYVELEQNEQLMKQKNDDLLLEMREINEALKNRGDVISKQNKEICDLQHSLEKSADRLRELEEEVKQKMISVEKLTTSIREYETKTNESFGDNQSEILSTSTISRIEESSRMRDIEDIFEEKYNKLRGLALKLKKKVAEQTVTITKLEAENSKNSDSGNLKIQNLKALQVENDKLLDKIDKLTEDNNKFKKIEKQLREDVEKHETEIRNLNCQIDDTKNLADANVKSKSAVDLALQEALKANKTLKNDADKMVAGKKKLEEEITKLKDEIKAKEAEIKTHKGEINKIKTSLKKNNVLNLEMEAYEKSLKESSQKLEVKTLRVTELESTSHTLENTVDAQSKQIKVLEENLKSEKHHSIELKQEVDMQQVKMKECEHEKIDLKSKLDECLKENNTIKLEMADIRLELTQYTVDKEKLITTLQSENEKNIRQIFAFEDEIRNLKAHLNEAEQELVNVRTDFASYKVRAQSVLRQNQTKDTSKEDELKEELSSALKSNENLTAKLNTIIEQNHRNETLLSEVNNDKDHLKARCKELLQLFDESRRQTDNLQEKSRKQLQENNESLKMQRVQIDMLNNCYKKQIADLEEKHAQEVLMLKASIKENDIKNLAVLEKSKNLSASLTDEQRIDLILTERQEGEGSESTVPIANIIQRKLSTARGKRDLIPLDELLNTPFDDNDNMAFDEERPVSPTTELHATRDKLNVQETRVKHLSTLLSEAELDVARLTQLNEVLKEELRRQDRSVEREKHMHNLEYIKNIIFKFLTINNADERAHLVPVLNTILKLSPDEANQLQTVARGGDGSQRGWTNILPMW